MVRQKIHLGKNLKLEPKYYSYAVRAKSVLHPDIVNFVNSIKERNVEEQQGLDLIEPSADIRFVAMGRDHLG